jgi:hypothetical protein
MDLFDLLAVAHQHYFMPLAVPLMLFMLMNGGCCCSPGCEFFSDDFNRANSDDPGDYTEVSGDWDIASNKLSTASSSGVLIGDTPHPDGEPNIKVSVTVNIATSGDRARIILNYVDSDNYWYAEARTGGSAYLRIYQRSGGVDTQMATKSITLSAGVDFTLCFSLQNYVNFSAEIDSTRCVARGATAMATSDQWGLGTGAGTGTRTFENLSVGIISTDCPRCQCAPSCSTCTVLPDYVVLTIADGSIEQNTNADCQSCTEAECQAAFEGVFILDRLFGTPFELNCQFPYNGSCAYTFGRCDDNFNTSNFAVCSGSPATPVIDVCTNEWGWMYLNIATVDSDTWSAVLDVVTQGTYQSPCTVGSICALGGFQMSQTIDTTGPAPFDCLAEIVVDLETVTDGYPRTRCPLSATPDVSFEWGT